MALQIVEFTTWHVRIPLRKTIRHASHTRDVNESLVVRCRLSDGTIGWGEGLPRPYVTGETIDTALAQLRRTDWSPLAAPIDDLTSAIELCDRFTPGNIDDEPEAANRHPHAARDCFGNSVRCAVELSVLDAVTRHMNVPLSQVTAHVPEAAAVRQASDRVRYSGAVTSESPRKQWLSAAKIRLFGFHQCKVKVGTEGIDDRDTLRRVRRILGPRCDIRIDANEAWSPEEIPGKMAPLAEYGITSLEQPVPHAEVDALAGIRPELSVPVMLDESLCSLSDAHRAVERGTCDLFNIRLSKCGGFVSSLKIAGVAHRGGLGYQLGCQVGETGILSAAGRHFACSVGGIRYLEGSYDRFLVRERLTRENLTFGYGGWAPALPGPGLGVSIDDNAIRRVTVTENHWAVS